MEHKFKIKMAQFPHWDPVEFTLIYERNEAWEWSGLLTVQNGGFWKNDGKDILLECFKDLDDTDGPEGAQLTIIRKAHYAAERWVRSQLDLQVVTI